MTVFPGRPKKTVRDLVAEGQKIAEKERERLAREEARALRQKKATQ